MCDRIVTGGDCFVRTALAFAVVSTALAIALIGTIAPAQAAPPSAPASGGAPPAPTRWAVLVGIDQYADSGISPLKGAVRDVTAIREALVTHARFPSEQVFLLTSDNPADIPTTGNILAKLDHVARRAGQDDFVYVHFALHGIADAKTGDGYLLTYRTDPARYREEGLALADVRARLSGMEARRKIVVLDACRNDPESGRGPGDNPMTEAITRGVKGVVREAPQRAGGFEAIFFGCAVGERAYEWPGKDRGIFSVALEEGLKGAGEGEDGDGAVTLAELARYVAGRMGDLMSLYAPPGKRQTPQVEPPAGAGAYEVSWGNGQAMRVEDLPAVSAAPTGPVEELPPVVMGGKPPTIEIDPRDRDRLAQALGKSQARRVAIRYVGLDDRAVKLYRWRLDDGPIQETKRGVADLAAPGPGTHTFQVQVQDVEGNWSTAARIEFQVLANQRPEVAFVELAEGQTVAGKALRVRLSGTDPDGRVASWRCAMDDPDSFETKDAPAFEFAEPVDGSHTLYAQSIDEDGALSLWVSRRIVFRYEDPAAVMPPPDPRPPGSGVSSELITNPVGMKFKPIPGKPYAMGVYEVTNGQYRAYKASHDSGSYKRQSLNGDPQPVVMVSAVDADAFCAWLTQREPGVTYRLPTEEEWEHACRAGRGDIEFPWGNEWPPSKGAGNYSDATAKKAFAGHWGTIDGYDDGYAVTSPVGSFEANPWGLYDLGGNVWEWTSSNSGSARVLRGASWGSDTRGTLRVASRITCDPTDTSYDIGFRVVRLSGSAR